MESYERSPIREARTWVRQLRDLGNVHAPATLLPSVLERVGRGDAYARIATPIGPVFVASNSLGISAVMRVASASEFEPAFRTRFGRPIHQVEELPAQLSRMLRQHLSGKGRPSLPIDLRGLSEFERAVLVKVREIPRGEVRPYAWVAQEIGHPRAVRAVGAVLGRNPVPLVIPCHRVWRSDGRLGGYIYGSETKRAVLAAEDIDVEALEDLATGGIRYYGSATTCIYCYPTCRHARRISERHRVPLRSAREATAMGYRPCTVCRPARAA
ncbi:MAG: methylated-DNA--[protein]-cysteine S-methyltransferase [Nitrospinae bacterium]|nr:methylated-DNA--[protein]-cysteine S-methyltransferase [Nitrospinota bacterium]